MARIPDHEIERLKAEVPLGLAVTTGSRRAKKLPASDDPFEVVHSLIGVATLKEALGLLLNSDTGRIKKPYGQDLNHAWYLVGNIYLALHGIEWVVLSILKRW